MKKQLKLMINLDLLTKNPKAMAALEELEAKGFYRNNEIVYDEEDEEEVFDIINKLTKINNE